MTKTLSVSVHPTAVDMLETRKILYKHYLPLSLRRRLFFFQVLVWLINIGAIFILFDRYHFLNENFFYDEVDARIALWLMLIALFVSVMLFNASLLYAITAARNAAFHPMKGRVFIYTLTPEGFTSEEINKVNSMYKWTTIERVIVEKTFILIFIDRCAAFPIQLRAFPDMEEAQRFFTLAHYYQEQARKTSR